MVGGHLKLQKNSESQCCTLAASRMSLAQVSQSLFSSDTPARITHVDAYFSSTFSNAYNSLWLAAVTSQHFCVKLLLLKLTTQVILTYYVDLERI